MSHNQAGSIHTLQQTTRQRCFRSFKQYIRNNLLGSGLYNMRLPILLQNFISWLFRKLLHRDFIRLRQNSVFIPSVFRCLSMIYYQRNPITLCFLSRILHSRILREVFLKSNGCRNIITCSQMIYPYFLIFLIIFPIVMSRLICDCQLEDSRFSGEFRICVFNIRSKADNHSIDEMVRFTCPVRSVILVVLVQLHSEVTIHLLLRQSACKSFIRIKHLFHS